MEQKSYKRLYQCILDDAYTTCDLSGYYDQVAPWILSKHQFVCSDEEKVMLYLVQYSFPDHSKDYFSFKVRKENEYFEYQLLNEHDDCSGPCFNCLKTEKVETRAINFLLELWNGGKRYVDDMLNQSGISWCDTLLITDKRLESVKKLSVSCTIAFFGEVFHGIGDIEAYCHAQTDKSSPYLLKRTFISDSNDYDCNIYTECRCTNYLICRDETDASRFAKIFIGLKRISAYSENYKYEDFVTPDGFPPMLCTAVNLPYFILAYTGQ